MKELGYLSEIDKLYRSIEFPSDFLGDFDVAIVQYFKRIEEWQSLPLLKRMEQRKGMLVHFIKCKEAYPEKLIPYTKLVIELGDLIIDFIKKVEHLFINRSETMKMSKEDITLYRFHAFLYCELFSINKEEKIEKNRHTLTELIIDPLLNELKETKYYEKYNLEEIELANKSVMELHKQKPFK